LEEKLFSDPAAKRMAASFRSIGLIGRFVAASKALNGDFSSSSHIRLVENMRAQSSHSSKEPFVRSKAAIASETVAISTGSSDLLETIPRFLPTILP
jgi:hypothetical protein